MIPRSNVDGYLPKGIYKAALNEIKERFGSSSLERKELFGAHLFIFTENDVSRYHRLVDFFGHDRDQKPKGLVEVVV